MTRAGCKGALALVVDLAGMAGCSTGDELQCLDGFCLPACLPAKVVIVGGEQPADFTLYQLAWRGEQFRLYAGDYPDFDIKRAASHAAPIDRDALLITGEASAQLRMRLGDASPRYLHLTGHCKDIAVCNLGQLAQAITRKPG